MYSGMGATCWREAGSGEAPTRGQSLGFRRQAGFCALCHKTTELKTDSTDPICFTLQMRLREQEKFPETRG